MTIMTINTKTPTNPITNRFQFLLLLQHFLSLLSLFLSLSFLKHNCIID